MTRLFWKFFIAFSLAIATVAAGVGASVWFRERPKSAFPSALSVDPRTGAALREAAPVLRYGGLAALQRFNEAAAARGQPQAFAVDESGTDVFNRAVPPRALSEARAYAAEPEIGRPGPRPTRRVTDPAGREYLVFMEQVDFGSPPPPPPRVPGVDYPWRIIIIGALAALVLSAILAWHFAKPARMLKQAFAAIGAGQLQTRVAPLMAGHRDEIADLGTAFDAMAARVQALMESQQRLMHDVSHELRSPLARLTAAIGIARQQPEAVNTMLDRFERECARLDDLIGELLTLSQLESGVGAPAMQPTDLAPILDSIVDDAQFEAQSRQRSVEYVRAPSAWLLGHAELLARALENVIRNAVKHTCEGTAVIVAAQQSSGEQGTNFSITVQDHGTGLPEGELAHIFEPFFRGAGARPHQGFGLGLAIARRAIEAHGGRITARNRAPGGLEVTIVLPAMPIADLGA